MPSHLSEGKRNKLCKSGSQIKVLYIEDDNSIQQLVADMLTLLGYDTACADNGKLGLEKAINWHPHVVITDLRMPVMDGFEVIRALRAHPDTANVPIFVLSAWSDENTRKTCKQLGADKYFVKPLSYFQINSAIQAALKPALESSPEQIRGVNEPQRGSN